MKWRITLEDPSGKVSSASSEQPFWKHVYSQKTISDYNRPTLYNPPSKNKSLRGQILKGIQSQSQNATALKKISNTALTSDPNHAASSSKVGFNDLGASCNRKKRSHTTSTANENVKRPKAIDFDESEECSQGDMLDPDDVPDELEEDLSGPKKVIHIRVDQIRLHVKMMSHMVQQKGVKKILVTWLKRGHPKKQASYPYNGGREPEKKPGYDKLNPGKNTAPPYWPKQDDWKNPNSDCCRHKEPDHVKKWGTFYFVSLPVRIVTNKGQRAHLSLLPSLVQHRRGF